MVKAFIAGFFITLAIYGLVFWLDKTARQALLTTVVQVSTIGLISFAILFLITEIFK